MSQDKNAYFALGGGLNLVTESTLLPPGMLIDSQNYEPEISGGYRRIDGHERYDGQAKPSDAVYYTMAVTATAAVGDTITGVTSAATAVVIAVESDGVAITKLVGTFVAGETINVAAAPVGTVDAAAIYSGAADPETNAEYVNLAADVYRADILAVPGSGPIRGVWMHSGVLYAFRDNAGATACVMYKATASGWVAITFGEEVSFSNANTSVADGDTLTQGGVTSTIARVVVQTGTLASGTNTGRLIITGRAGGNFAGGAATSTGAGALTLSGAQTAITLLPGGRFECISYNFGGAAGTYRMYGADGVNRAFEFDGTTFVPIATGMSADTPNLITAHKNHLFLSFGTSMQHSSIGAPYMWSVVTGAAELAMGDTVTLMLPQPGSQSDGAMAVCTTNSTGILYGSSSATWSLVQLSDSAGAVAYTGQNIEQGYMWDESGLRTLATTQNFGNFEQGTISNDIQPLVELQRGKAIASCAIRKRNQYRVFFDDNRVLVYARTKGKSLGFTLFDYGRAVRCICSVEDSTGKERVFFGSDDGYVYEDGVGTSFDGEAIGSWARLVFSHQGTPGWIKHYRRAHFVVKAEDYAVVSVSYDLGYGDSNIEEAASSDATLSGSGGWLDQFTWENFTWDAKYTNNPIKSLGGSAENIGLLFYGSSDSQKPHVLQTADIVYTIRRRAR